MTMAVLAVLLKGWTEGGREGRREKMVSFA
jgi:hypothetical protein